MQVECLGSRSILNASMWVMAYGNKFSSIITSTFKMTKSLPQSNNFSPINKNSPFSMFPAVALTIAYPALQG